MLLIISQGLYIRAFCFACYRKGWPDNPPCFHFVAFIYSCFSLFITHAFWEPTFHFTLNVKKELNYMLHDLALVDIILPTFDFTGLNYTAFHFLRA